MPTCCGGNCKHISDVLRQTTNPVWNDLLSLLSSLHITAAQWSCSWGASRNKNQCVCVLTQSLFVEFVSENWHRRFPGTLISEFPCFVPAGAAYCSVHRSGFQRSLPGVSASQRHQPRGPESEGVQWHHQHTGDVQRWPHSLLQLWELQRGWSCLAVHQSLSKWSKQKSCSRSICRNAQEYSKCWLIRQIWRQMAACFKSCLFLIVVAFPA